MKLNNRGLTLIEMIVSFAILGVVSVAVFGMMLTSTKTYTSLTTSVKLQYEAQLAMANIERHILNCNDEISWNSTQKTLFIINKEGDTKTIEVFDLNGSGYADAISYGTKEIGEDGTAEILSYLLAEHVEDLNVELIPSASGDIAQVQLELKMTRNDKSYIGKKIIALRNKPSGSHNTWNINYTAGRAEQN